MRTKRMLALVLVVSASLTVLLQMGVATGQTVLHLVVPADGGKARFIDHFEDGLRLADRVAARNVVTDTEGAEVGMAYLECVVERRIWDDETGLWNCNYVLDLEEGDIILQGLDPRGPGTYEMAVLGGTGAYASASGDAMFTDAPSGTDMVISLDS